MKIWIAYVDHCYEGKEVLSIHATREGAKEACEKNEKAQYKEPEPIDWEDEGHAYSEGWSMMRYIVVAATIKP